MRLIGLAIIFPLLIGGALAQERDSLPAPVKFLNKFEVVWDSLKEVLKEMEFEIELEDRPRGRIVTKPHEFISGAIASEALEKLAARPDSSRGIWAKGRYRVEALVEILEPNETMVSVSAEIEGLKRDLANGETWTAWRSNGTLERRILGRLSMKLFAPESQLNEKKGFWETPRPPVLSPKEGPKPLHLPEREKP